MVNFRYPVQSTVVQNEQDDGSVTTSVVQERRPIGTGTDPMDHSAYGGHNDSHDKPRVGEKPRQSDDVGALGMARK